jgi:hypothetical protein
MKKLEIKNYPNLLDHLKIKSTDVLEIIKNYPLTFSQIKNDKVEWGIKFPMFLTPFYKYVYINNKILTQNEFYEYYIFENQTFFYEKKFNDEILEGLKARLFRTYPSLIRDLHFNLYVKEKIQEALVIYNRKLDVEEGIDQLLLYNNKFYAINLYTDTARAHIGRDKKVSRHTPFDNVEYIELPVSFKGSVKCGEFFLYGQTELLQITKILYKL